MTARILRPYPPIRPTTRERVAVNPSLGVTNKRAILSLIPLLTIALAVVAQAQEKNGFDLSNATIPTSKIFSGGPPRDGIPAIDKPRFVSVEKVDFLRDEDIVLSLTRGDMTRAYPLRVLVWHEIVNDTFDGSKVAVTYCPLCGTGMVFDGEAGGKVRRFGVSGLLYQSDVLMYDRETESLWSQLKMAAISGPDVGAKLKWLPSEHMTWKAWRTKYPGGHILSTNTGHRRDYASEAYANYFASDGVMFPVPTYRDELRNKEPVIGVIVNGQAKAYPISQLTAEPLRDTVGGQRITVNYDPESQAHSVTLSDGTAAPSVRVFWFAWQGFYPDTELHETSASP